MQIFFLIIRNRGVRATRKTEIQHKTQDALKKRLNMVKH